MKRFFVLLFLSYLLVPQTYAAPDDHQKDREELKIILSDIQNGLNKMDMDAILAPLSENVTISFITTEVAVGKKQIRAYYSKMFEGDDAPLSDYKTEATIDAPAIFHSDTAVAHGRAQDIYILKDGSVYQFNTRWTAAAVKNNDKWEVININFSVDTFDNVVLEELNKNMWIYVILALLSGLIVGYIAARKK